jgi:hypothetical protein
MDQKFAGRYFRERSFSYYLRLHSQRYQKMKPQYLPPFALLWLACFTGNADVAAQSKETPAVTHMRTLSDREDVLSQNYMSYMSEVAHRGRARKMEKRRNELIATVRESIREASKLKPFEGDASLRDAYKDYWSVLLSVFTEEYHKIVDMEEVAEQSYDAMETYLLVQEKAGEKMDEAHEKLILAYRLFAANHKVTLSEGAQTKLSRKLAQTGKVNKYTNQVYLIYFKSSVQEGMMMKALNAKDINAVEQARGSMARYAAEGLSRLDTVKVFQGDGSLINACRKILTFQQSEAEKFTAITAFLIKNEEFEKMKKTYDTKPANKRTQADVDQFNNAVKDLNDAVNTYNKVNHELNTNRNKAHEQWESAHRQFMDQHVPHS